MMLSKRLKILKNIKMIYILTILVLILAGCAPSRLDFKEESLTGEKYCVASNRLDPLKNSEEAVFCLQYTKEESLKKAPLRATLEISQKGREYNINPHESLKLILDGNSYILPVINSFQKPLELVSYNPVAIGNATIMLGSVNEVTKRKMAFLFSHDYLSKILAAKQVRFEISVPSGDVNGYPILLDLNSESITFLKEFQQNCVNNFPN